MGVYVLKDFSSQSGMLLAEYLEPFTQENLGMISLAELRLKGRLIINILVPDSRERELLMIVTDFFG
jgi:hypothetical protein